MRRIASACQAWVCRGRQLPAAEQRRAGLLVAMVLSLVPAILGMLLGGIVARLTGHTELHHVLPASIVLLLGLPLPLLMARYTRPCMGGGVLVAMFLVFAHGHAYLHGLGHFGVVVYAVAALTAATLLGWLWGPATVLVSAVSYLWIGRLQIRGGLPSPLPPTDIPITNAAGLVLAGATIVAFHAVYAQWMDRTLQRERDLHKELRLAHETLEVRVRERTEELAEREALYRLLAENASDMIVRIDAGGLIDYASPACGAILGCDPAALLGIDPVNLAHPDDADPMEDVYQALLRGEDTPPMLHARLRRCDGSFVWTESLFRALRDEATGELTQIVAVTRDVTHERQLEAQLRQHAILRAVGHLAGGVAHRYNNLMQVINGHAELALADPSLSQQMQADLQEIRRAGHDAAALTTRLLAYAQRQELRPQVTAIGPLLAEQAPSLRAILGPQVEVALETHTACRAYVDPDQLGHVMANLAMNAAAAMPDGGKFTVTAEPVTLPLPRERLSLPDGAYVRLAVRDTGPGMDAETRDVIFQPFAASRNLAESEGLGLAVVYGVIRQSGGDLALHSSPGEGTTITLYLPAEPPAGPHDETAPELA